MNVSKRPPKLFQAHLHRLAVLAKEIFSEKQHILGNLFGATTAEKCW